MITALLAQLATDLDRLGLAYMVIGGQAVLLHGEPRLTRDIDLCLAADPSRAADLISLARLRGWRLMVTDPEAFVARHLVLPCEDEASGVRLDFIFGLTDYERQAVARADAVPMNAVAVRFATVEDLIMHKLFAGRPRDIEDLRGILARKPQLDAAYLDHWLARFDRDLNLALRNRWQSLLF